MIFSREISPPPGFHGVSQLFVDFIIDEEIYHDGVNIEKVQIVPAYTPYAGKWGSNYFQDEMRKNAINYIVDVSEWLSEAAFDAIKLAIVELLKAEKEADELEAEVENYR